MTAKPTRMSVRLATSTRPSAPSRSKASRRNLPKPLASEPRHSLPGLSRSLELKPCVSAQHQKRMPGVGF
jgi:hypothetical protein